MDSTITFIHRNINNLYQQLEVIKLQIMNTSYVYTEDDPRVPMLTTDQRYMIGVYSRMYTSTINHLTQLYDYLHRFHRNDHLSDTTPLFYYNGNFYTSAQTDTDNTENNNHLYRQPPVRSAQTPLRSVRPYTINTSRSSSSRNTHRPRSNVRTRHSSSNSNSSFTYPNELRSTNMPPLDLNIPSLTTPINTNYNPLNYTLASNNLRDITTPSDIIANLFRNMPTSFNDPVVVAPTPENIANSTSNQTFSSILNPINSNCPICLDVFESDTEVMQIIHCGHIFIPHQLNRWFQNNVRCPVCRYDIRDYEPNQTNDSGTNNTPVSPIHNNEGDNNAEDDVEDDHDDEEDVEDVVENVVENDIGSLQNINSNTSSVLPTNRHREIVEIQNQTTNALQDLLTNEVQGIFHNLFTNPEQPIENFTYDASDNAIVFDNFISR